MQRIIGSTIPRWYADLKTVLAIGVLLALLFSSAEGTRLVPYPDASVPVSECSGLDDSRYSYNQTVKPGRAPQSKSAKNKHGGQVVDVPQVVWNSESQFNFAYVPASFYHRSFSFRSFVTFGPNDTRGPPSI